jgi:hypothetical protein
MTITQSKRTFCLSTATLLLAASPAGAAPAAKANRAGAVDFVDGSASVTDTAGSRSLRKGTVVYAGQAIETGKDSEVHLIFDDGGYLAVRPSSRIQIDQVKMLGAFDDTLGMTLIRGALRSITGWVGKFDRHSYQLTAGTATIGIRGTDHEVALIPAGEEGPDGVAGVHSWVNEGGTTLHNAGGSFDVQPGQAAWASHDGKAPQSEGAIPAFLQRRRTRFESRAAAHGSKIREHIEARLRKRGMLKKGEHLEDAQARHQALLQKREERLGHTEKSEERRAERRKRMEEMRAHRKEQHRP